MTDLLTEQEIAEIERHALECNQFYRDVLALIATVRALRAEVERLREYIENIPTTDGTIGGGRRESGEWREP